MAADLLWRTCTSWRGMRAEVALDDRSPAEIIREHVRVTCSRWIRPPRDTAAVLRTCEHMVPTA